MSKNSSLPQNQQSNHPKLPQQIPITYLWFGKEVPEDYLISLSQLNYPTIFLKNPVIQRKFSRQIMDIEKSDYYRLQYLYDHGGIYSDFDNIIDYDCLMKLLAPFRNQDKLVFMSVGNHNRKQLKQMSNNLIFAPYPKLPILKKMLDGVNQKKGKIWNFAGMRYVGTFSQPVQLNMDKCVLHTGDWSWAKASNQVLHKNRPMLSRFTVKLKKKKDILAQKNKLQNEAKQFKSSKDKLNNEIKKLKGQNSKLKQEITKSGIDLQKKMAQTLKAQTQHNNQIPVNKQLQSDWSKEKSLTEKNDKLEYEKDALLMVTGGSLILLLVVIIALLFVILKKKQKQFKEIANTEKSIATATYQQ